MIDTLIKKIRETAPIVVGLDPRLEHIPESLKRKKYIEAEKEFTEDRVPFILNVAAECIYEFNKGIIDAVCDIVPAVKPQIAMYEQYGSEGIRCYERTVWCAKSKGLIVIGDVKRGDIASTAEAYSTGHLGSWRTQITGLLDGAVSSGAELHEFQHKPDFITLAPYMGADSIEPYFANMRAHDKGIFVLVKTSNPGSRDIQDLILQNGKPLYEHVGGLVEAWGADFIGESGYSAVGAVVGATHPDEAARLRKIMPHTFFLVPGYGAQGGSGKDLAGLWDEKNFGMIVNSSRGITGAYLSGEFKRDEKDFAAAARDAALAMKRDLEAYM
ncbi:MAG: orotidine-5'-phosphate decarboxylase [Defluviitaleaceae bacterium]|nr:orotidine-5'-phosphate decarboxylase [Defluviitaleaceae bacterium]